MPAPYNRHVLAAIAVFGAALTLYFCFLPFPEAGLGSSTPTTSTTTPSSKQAMSLRDVLALAVGKAAKGGFAGMVAGVVQVLAFMWLRTAMNQQYANGGTLKTTLQLLWNEGGVLRFYKGVEFAIFQAPLTRFGDTFTNTAAVVIFGHFRPDATTAVVTFAGSLMSACFRIAITPVDTLKTTRQVHGDAAFQLLLTKIRSGGVRELFAGWEANFAASWAGIYPWFYTFNYLNTAWSAAGWVGPWKHVRNASIGMCATTASDVVSNSLRVLKTIRQTHPDSGLGYIGAGRAVIKQEGVAGLLGRGLKTRLFVNLLQGMVFTVIWRAIQD